MKTNHVLILAVMACLLLVAAGCTGIPGAPASSGAAAPSFTGKWMTTWQAGEHDIPMTLTQTGSSRCRYL